MKMNAAASKFWKFLKKNMVHPAIAMDWQLMRKALAKNLWYQTILCIAAQNGKKKGIN
jgi:hypothetical protein